MDEPEQGAPKSIFSRIINLPFLILIGITGYLMKFLFWIGLILSKITFRLTHWTAKGSYITMKSGGRGLLIAASKAFPREPDETIWQYRKRMAKIGFRVSIFTGKIVMAANGSASVQEFALKVGTDAVKGAVRDKILNEIMYSSEISPRRKVFELVSRQGINIGDFDSFNQRMETDEGRRRFYAHASSAGLPIGSWEHFEQRMK